MMQTHHVLPRINKRASGLTYAVPGICAALHAEGISATLHVASAALQEYPFEVRSYPKWPIFRNIALSPALCRGLNQLQGPELILHNHSLWTMPSLYAGILGSKSQFRMVFSPHGTLSAEALERSRWKKRLFWAMGQKQALQNAVCFHVTALHEAEDLRKMGLTQPVAHIPLGLDLPSYFPPPEMPPFRVLFLARLHPHKGLDMLIDAWKKLGVDFPEWELHIAGPEDEKGYLRHLHALAGAATRVFFHGPVFDAEKERFFRSGALYVLPSRSENFGVTVAEALSAGIPTIVTKGAPWGALTESACGWWVHPVPEALEQALREAMSMPAAERIAMGERGRALIEARYSWANTGRRFRTLYEWLLRGSTKPDFVLD